jgi:cysteine rich repeat protein
MRMRYAFVVAAAMLLAANIALAADKAAPKDRVCADDVKKFCSNVRPGEGRIYKCLMDRSAEINPACRDRVSAAKARYDQFEQACGSDAQKFCKSIPPGGGRVLSCLKGRESDLSPACRAEYSRAKNDPTLAR